MVLPGMALTAGSDPFFVINLETGPRRAVSRSSSRILLFLDATEIPARAFRRSAGAIILRLLVIAAAAVPRSGLVVAGLVFFPDENYWVLAVLATVIVPIDLAPAGPVLRDKRIPAAGPGDAECRERTERRADRADLPDLPGRRDRRRAGTNRRRRRWSRHCRPCSIAVLVGLAIGLLGA